MVYLLALIIFTSTARAATEPPPDCNSKLTVHVPESAIVRHQERFHSLLKRFRRVTMEATLNNGMMLHITSKDALRNLPMIHPSSLERKVRILIRSKAETKSSQKELVEDWSQFDVRAGEEAAGGALAADLFVDIGDWVPVKPREMALHTLNIYVAMSMVPYFRHFVVHVPIFDDFSTQTPAEHELKRQAFEEILALKDEGLPNEEVIRAIKLPQVRFIATMLPLRLERVTIVRSGNSNQLSADDGFDIKLFYSAL